MSSKLPYFKWYPKDAETDILYCRLTDQELGLYHRCLNLAWINGGLPTDLHDLAEALGKSFEYIERAWPRISKCFSIVGERYINSRQERERKVAVELSDKRSSAGKQGGRPKKQLLSKHKASLYESEYVCSSSEDTTPKTESTSPRAKLPVEEWFVEFWSLYWRKVDRANAFKAFKKYATDEETKTRIIDAVRAQTSQYAARESDKRPHAATWLNGRRYEDDPEVYQPAMSKLDRIMEAL